MKKFFSIFAFIAVAAIALTSCSKESDTNPINENGVKMKTITVRTGIATKTTLDSDHSKLVWSSDDKISLFNNANTDNAGLTYQSGGDITVSVPEATTEIYAHYPYFNGNTSGPSNVSVYINKNQTQKNPGELNGYYYPMVAKGTVSEDNKALISFYPVASALALNIYNTELSDTETVISVKVTPNSENTGFIGRQYMNLTGTSLKYNNAEASDAITVTLTNPLTLSNTKPANPQTFNGQIYVCLAKQSYKNVKFEITTDKAVYTITSNDTPFDCASKDFVPVNINLKNAAKVLTFQEHFKTDQGTFSIEGTTGVWTHATYNGDAYMKGTSYINKQNTNGEAWLISPALAIQNNNSILSFSHIINNYFGNLSNEATVWIREVGGNWTQLTGFNYPTINENGWSNWEDEELNLNSYSGKTIQIGFKYIGTTTTAGTWEVKNFKLTHAILQPTFNITSETTKTVPAAGATVEFTYIAAGLINEPTVAIKTGSNDIIEGTPTISNGIITAVIKANTDENTKTATLVVSCEGVTNIPELTINQNAYSAGNLIDVITRETTGVANGASTYSSWEDKTVTSPAVYAGNSAGSHNSIQMRTTNSNSGIITTTSGGYAKKITVTWNENTSAERVLNVYGKTTAYSNASDLYGSLAGTLIGTINYDSDSPQELVIPGNYTYLGLRSASGALYLDEIDIEWSTTPVTLTSIAVNGQNTSFTQGGAFSFGGTVTATYSDNSTKDVTSSATFSGYDLSNTGNQTVTVSYTEDGITKTTTYGITVSESSSGGSTIDVLTQTWTGITGSSYTNWSGKTSNSGAVYAGNSAGSNSSIQLRSKNSSGIITTKSGGKATKVVVTWNESTLSGRTLNIYGKNTAYSNTSDLYGSSAGTLLGTIVCGTSTTLNISGDYTFIGLRSNADAMYLSEIQITWE